MNITRHDLLALALGQLGPTDQQRVQEAINADPALRSELRHDLEALTRLLDDLDPDTVPLPERAAERLAERVRAESLTAPGVPVSPPVSQADRGALPAAEPARPDGSWWWPALLGLALAVGLGLALRNPADLPGRYAATPGAQVYVLQQENLRIGRMVRLSDGRVYVQLERPLESGRTYQLWRLLPGKPGHPRPRSLGLFEGGIMTRPMPRNAVLAVSSEPPGGSDAPTTPLLFKQRL